MIFHIFVKDETTSNVRLASYILHDNGFCIEQIAFKWKKKSEVFGLCLPVVTEGEKEVFTFLESCPHLESTSFSLLSAQEQKGKWRLNVTKSIPH